MPRKCRKKIAKLTEDEYKRLRQQRKRDRIKDAENVGHPPPTDSEIRKLLDAVSKAKR